MTTPAQPTTTESRDQSCEHCGRPSVGYALRECDYCGSGLCSRCEDLHDGESRCPLTTDVAALARELTDGAANALLDPSGCSDEDFAEGMRLGLVYPLDCVGDAPVQAYVTQRGEALLARLDELWTRVRSWGLVRCLRRVAGHGPSTAQPGVTSAKLDGLRWIGLVDDGGIITPLGRAVLQRAKEQRR